MFWFWFWLIFGAVLSLSVSISTCLYFWWCDKDIPSIKGPMFMPVLGNMRDFSDHKQITKVFSNLHKKFGKNFRAYFGNELDIFTTDVDLIELAVTSNKTLNKGDGYRFLHNWLGTGLLTSPGAKWHKRRKMITPAYHFSVLEQFIETFNKNGDIMVAKLMKEVDKPQIDIFPFVNLCALDIICESAMGTRVNAQLEKDNDYVNAIKVMNGIIIVRNFEVLKVIDFTYKFTQDYRREVEALKVIHGYTMKVIKSRREELLKHQSFSQDKANKEEDLGVKRKDNFLDILLKSAVDGQPLSDEDIREEVDTFMFEGHDTVSSAMSFAFYLISNHREVQKQLVDEQRTIFGSDPQRSATMRDLQEMKYLEMVIKETLRLYPSVPMMGREVTEPLMFKNCKFQNKTQIVINVFELHRDPGVFPDPEKFVPERFLPDNILGRHPYAYIPFSAGHRNCIGQKFAMLEMKSTISKVIRNFELVRLVPRHVPNLLSEIVIRSSNGVLLKLKTRDW